MNKNSIFLQAWRVNTQGDRQHKIYCKFCLITINTCIIKLLEIYIELIVIN